MQVPVLLEPSSVGYGPGSKAMAGRIDAPDVDLDTPPAAAAAAAVIAGPPKVRCDPSLRCGPLAANDARAHVQLVPVETEDPGSDPLKRRALSVMVRAYFFARPVPPAWLTVGLR
jgi:hypothetical protein